MAKRTVDIDAQIDGGDWSTHIANFQPKEWFAACLECVDSPKKHVEVSLVYATDARIQELNKHYRHKDAPTNVLSFPVPDNSFTRQAVPVNLGDIVLSFETIVNESVKENKPFVHHVAHLCIHGFFHLLGYDHETDEDATEMESLEVLVLKKFDIPNPYV